MLEARNFTILTDKPLIFAFHQKRDKCSSRQINHLDFISQFKTDIRQISGKDNVADELSRVDVIIAPVKHDALAAAQEDDEELRTLLASNTALQLTKIPIPGTSAEPYCNISSGKPHPYIPSPFCRRIFNSLHSLSQPGIKAKVKLISQRFVWPVIQKDCRTWARACKPANAPKFLATLSPVGNFTHPPARFLHIHSLPSTFLRISLLPPCHRSFHTLTRSISNP